MTTTPDMFNHRFQTSLVIGGLPQLITEQISELTTTVAVNQQTKRFAFSIKQKDSYDRHSMMLFRVISQFEHNWVDTIQILYSSKQNCTLDVAAILLDVQFHYMSTDKLCATYATHTIIFTYKNICYKYLPDRIRFHRPRTTCINKTFFDPKCYEV